MQGLMVVDKVTSTRNIGHGQCGCKVGTSRRSHMQGLMVVGFIIDQILRAGFKNDKVTRAPKIGQGH